MLDRPALDFLLAELALEELCFLRTSGEVRLRVLARFCGLTDRLVDFLTSVRRSVLLNLVEGRVELVEGLTVLEGLVEERFVPGTFCLIDGLLRLSVERPTSGLRI